MTLRYPGFFLLLIFAGQLHAGIYTWKDAAGRTHFGDRPPLEAQADQVRLRINTYSSPEIRPLSDFAPVANRQQVLMYSTEWCGGRSWAPCPRDTCTSLCGVCKRAKGYFREKNIPFREYDVEKSAKGREDYRRLKGRGVPIILVGNQRMNGFSRAQFESIYQAD